MKRYLKDKNLRNIPEVKSYIDYEECHHDETPIRDCEPIDHKEKG